MKPTLYLDAGHGGLHPFTGRYVTAPSKMYDHKRGDFHLGTIFCEGVWNRTFANKLASAVDDVVEVVKIYDDWKDTGLRSRVAFANRHWKNSGKPPAILISIHSNAGKGKGWEVFTGPGQTKSDRFASVLWLSVQKVFPGPMRYDFSDRDHDKEARFTICVDSDMPAVLTENLFFDTFEEAELLMDPAFQDILSSAYRDAIISFFDLRS